MTQTVPDPPEPPGAGEAPDLADVEGGDTPEDDVNPALNTPEPPD